MRSIYIDYDELESQNLIINKDEEHFHYLTKVSRLKIGEIILVLNGKGRILKSIVKSISHSNIELNIISNVMSSKKHSIDIALGIPKKDYFEEVIRICSESGIQKLLPVKSEFSQHSYMPSKRVEKIITSAMMQSNNPWKMEISEQISSFESLKDVFFQYERVILFSSQTEGINNIIIDKPNIDTKVLLVIGPEAGFSSCELKLLNDLNIETVELSVPILKTITAVPVAIGWFLGRIY